jgi:hypothetical protein
VENYKCHITIENQTSFHLKYVKSDLPWGKFVEGPVADILPDRVMVAFVASGSVGPAGTEGTVWYQLGDDANKTISIYFDIPTTPFSSNTVKVDASQPKIAAMLQGFKGSGSDEACIVRVVGG